MRAIVQLLTPTAHATHIPSEFIYKPSTQVVHVCESVHTAQPNGHG